VIRERGARAGIRVTMAHGLVGWGVLVGIAAAILLIRVHFAQASRAPLPPLTGTLSSAQQREWKSFPDYRDVVPVLTYHGVGGRPSYLTVPRPLFAAQMRALKIGGFHPLTEQQYAAFVRGDTAALPSRPILLTFDDGRLDAYRAASGILASYGFHATEMVVPGWVTEHPRFSLSWAELNRMSRSGAWDIEAHFGFGQEDVRVDKAGHHGAVFGYLAYIPGTAGRQGHLETFAQFQKRFTGNMLWAVRQLREKLAGYRPVATAIPESDYGQAGTNDLLIPPYVLSWLNHHFPVVFGGDYLDRGQGRPFQIGGRFSPTLSYRMAMGPNETLAALHCRLLDYVRHAPIWTEYQCLRQSRPAVSRTRPVVPALRNLHTWRPLRRR
jgi:hypothetical protein